VHLYNTLQRTLVCSYSLIILKHCNELLNGVYPIIYYSTRFCCIDTNLFISIYASPFAPLQKHICHLQTQRMPRSPRVPMCSVEGFARLRTGCPRRWREGGCCSRERVLLALGRFATQTGFLWLQTNQYDWGFTRI
jgi:hypothetical protein